MQPDVDIVPAPTQDPIDAFGVGRGQADRLAELGHELKTPINGILGILSLLRATTLDPEQREMVDLMWDSAEAQSKLVARLNHSVVADAGTGADQAQDTRFVPRRVLESVVGLMRPAADEKGLALLLVVDPSADAPLRGRVDALRQILLNLVGNAVKFTAAGEIRVTASCPPSPDQADAIMDAGGAWTSRSETPGRAFRPVTAATCSNGSPGVRRTRKDPAWDCISARS